MKIAGISGAAPSPDSDALQFIGSTGQCPVNCAAPSRASICFGTFASGLICSQCSPLNSHISIYWTDRHHEATAVLLIRVVARNMPEGSELRGVYLISIYCYMPLRLEAASCAWVFMVFRHVSIWNFLDPGGVRCILSSPLMRCYIVQKTRHFSQMAPFF